MRILTISIILLSFLLSISLSAMKSGPSKQLLVEYDDYSEDELSDSDLETKNPLPDDKNIDTDYSNITEEEENPFDNEGYDLDGFDEHGRDRQGYDMEGYNKDGFDRFGNHRDGCEVSEPTTASSSVEEFMEDSDPKFDHKASTNNKRVRNKFHKEKQRNRGISRVKAIKIAQEKTPSRKQDKIVYALTRANKKINKDLYEPSESEDSSENDDITDSDSIIKKKSSVLHGKWHKTIKRGNKHPPIRKPTTIKAPKKDLKITLEPFDDTPVNSQTYYQPKISASFYKGSSQPPRLFIAYLF